MGALLPGSAQARDPEEPHPPNSDVDLFIYADAEVPSDILEPRGRLAPRKLAFRGVVLEPSFHEARRISDPEAVLGDMHLALVFTEPRILLENDGGEEARVSSRIGYRRLLAALEIDGDEPLHARTSRSHTNLCLPIELRGVSSA